MVLLLSLSESVPIQNPSYSMKNQSILIPLNLRNRRKINGWLIKQEKKPEGDKLTKKGSSIERNTIKFMRRNDVYLIIIVLSFII